MTTPYRDPPTTLGQNAGSVLDEVRIARPCSASWDDMVGDDLVRFCGFCNNDVFNVSAMTADEAVALLRDRGGRLCLRLFRRADGTVMTSDCPVGVRRVRRRVLAVVAGAGLAAGGVALATAPAAHRSAHTQQGDRGAGEQREDPVNPPDTFLMQQVLGAAAEREQENEPPPPRPHWRKQPAPHAPRREANGESNKKRF